MTLTAGWIPQKALVQLDYKYVSPTCTPLEKYILVPFWEAVVQCVPKWVAPNLLTLAGWICMVVPTILFLILDPTFSQDLPPWLYYVTAISIFLYQTFDGIDGKQARRTKTGSVLGELFDHGCDAITALLMNLVAMHCMAMGPGWSTVCTILASMGTFQMFTFEKRFTRVLRTGLDFFGAMEAHFFIMIVLTCTGIWGT
jgi:ethanolaminephosphotransferase